MKDFFDWSKTPPPISTWVWCIYAEGEKWQLFKTCKRGCCVYSLFGTMRLPKFWYLASQEEGLKEQASWNNTPEINLGYLD